MMHRLAATLACTVTLVGCSIAVYGPRLHAPADVPNPVSVHGHKLKVHLMSGDLVVLASWSRSDTALAGHGERYDERRRVVGQGSFVLPFDSIALLESEARVGSRPSGLAGMVVWTTATGVLTAVCVLDPKACFGSCPTFYVATDSGEQLAAEGFSASIARALEAKDLDPLFAAHPAGGRFTIRMRNEALETHAVKSLALLAAPRPAGGRMLASPDGRLYPATDLRAPTACRADEGDCRAALEELDAVERISSPDSVDLAAKESIELTFPGGAGRLGLVLATRQSLLSTYLFYQTMGFLGTHAGDVLAALERGGPAVASQAMGMARIIAPLDVELLNGGRWKRIGVLHEAGPLAVQIAVLPFDHEAAGPVHVRLTASKGARRLDWAAVANLGDPVQPIAVVPEAVLRDGEPDSTALALLRDPDAYLVTYPGDSYDVVFGLPSAAHIWDVFLLSEGYYYEWMRTEWLADEDPTLAALVLTNPASALRVLAPEFARAAPRMDEVFWSSKFAR